MTRLTRRVRRSDKRNRVAAVLFGSIGLLAGSAAIALLWASGPRAAPALDPAPRRVADGPPVLQPPAPSRSGGAPSRVTVGAEPVDDLRQRQLDLPVLGMDRDDLHPSFNDPRGAGRRHEALDIVAPRHTPIVAVEDGTIARLFTSDAGGLTIYQFDPSTTYTYYYAHLERYADRLRDGDRVRRGQVLGYVGTSGNAPKGTPHLHFGIFKLTEQKRWWEGVAIDPYPVLR